MHSLDLPVDWHLLQFHSGQSGSISDEWKDYGTVVEVQYQDGWHYAIDLDDAIAHKFVDPVHYLCESEVNLR